MSGSFSSVPQMLLHRVAETPDNLAYQFPKGDNDWGKLTWKEAGDRVRAIACGLLARGIEVEQRVAIQASTRIEWVLADLGILCAGAATTTVYPSNTPEECAYILTDSGTRMVFAENQDQADKLIAERANLGDVSAVILFEGSASDDGWILTLDQLEEEGRKFDAENPDKYDEVINSLTPQHLATLIYTSGTTGKPKGVELIHDCWLATAEGIAAMGLIQPDDHQYLWLPLSHSFGKVLESMQIIAGFPTTVDGRIPKLIDNLAVIRPTFMAAAPRIFEKVYNKVVTGAREKGGLAYKIFTWSVKVGNQVSKIRQEGKEPGGFLAFKHAIADKLVFSKLRARFGGKLKFFISGSAPLSREMAEFFHGAGILILEGYGLTETSAASFVNRPEAYAFGTVGQAVGDMQIKIAEEDGEILLKGRGVMRGYHNLADKTAEVFTEDGWFRTGDIGETDANGFLKITDRKKDLIKTSGGKYVAPQMIEGKLKALCPYIGHVIVHGDRRNFCTALVSVEEESLQKWAQDNGLSGGYSEWVNTDQVKQLVQTAVDTMNEGLASYETIKKFAILPAELTLESGDLTPSMKVRRKVVEKKYMDLLDGFYTGAMA